MAPTSPHTLLPRNDPSLAQLFHHFPAKIWLICKTIIFGLAVLLALYGIVIGIYCLFLLIGAYVPRFSQWLRSGKWKEDVEGWRDGVGRSWRIGRVDGMWKWLGRRGARWKAEDVDAEELEHLSSRNGEESEGSVGGETLFEGEEDDDDGNGQASKKEGMEVNTKD